MDPDTLDPEVVLLLKKQQEDEINEGASQTAADLALNNARIEADIDATVERVGKGPPLHPADDPDRRLRLLQANTFGTPEEVRQYWSQYKIYYQYMTVDRTTHGFYFRCMSLGRAFSIKHIVVKFVFL